jgi:diguanylate cyclase (GGDEF)-like protein
VVQSKVPPDERRCGLLSHQAFRWLATGATALLLGEIAIASSGVLGWSASISLNKAWELAASIAALVAWAWSAVRHGGPRHRWRWWMTTGMASFAIGLASWSWVQVFGATPIPTGTLGPAGFTLTPILALLALIIRTFGRGTDDRSPLGTRRNRAVQLLDLMIITVSVTLFVVAALREPLARRSVIVVSNATAYLVLLAGIVMLARIRPGMRDRQVLLMALAALAYTVSSLLFAHYYVSLQDTFPPALEAGYMACPVFFFLAALAPATTDTWSSYQPTGREMVQLAVPYLPLIGTVLFLAGGLVAGNALTRQQQIILLLLLSVVILRQLVTLVENRLLLGRAEHQALHDPLTGIANRTLFLHELEESLASLSESDSSLVLAFCDMDDFKEVNDALGHTTGDLVLQEAARRLEHCAKPGDLVARLGGDEFALVLRDVHEPLDDLGRRLLNAMQEPHMLGGRPHVISASIGITAIGDEHTGRCTEDFLRSADIAMYTAKRRGKNTLAHTLEPEQEHA